MMGRHNADLEGTIFGLSIDVDFKDPERYAVYVGQCGLGLPDRDYYLKPDFAAQKTKYQNYVAKLLRLINWPDADKRARDVVDFESRIAEASWTKTQQRDPIATYNPMSIAELETFAPNFRGDNTCPKPASAKSTTSSSPRNQRFQKSLRFLRMRRLKLCRHGRLSTSPIMPRHIYRSPLPMPFSRCVTRRFPGKLNNRCAGNEACMR